MYISSKDFNEMMLLMTLSFALEFPPAMKDQCIRNGGEEAYINVQRNLNQLMPCFMNLTDWEQLRTDIGEAVSQNRSINEVFMKTCSGKSELFGCITELTESFKPCFRADERARGNLDIVRNVIDQLLDFILCQESGALITPFVEGREECWQKPDTEKALTGCLRGLLPIFPERSNTVINAVLGIDYNDNTCGILHEFQKCVVQELKTCSQEVANVTQSLIRSTRLGTPCKDASGQENCYRGGVAKL